MSEPASVPPPFEPLAHYPSLPLEEMRRRIEEFHAEIRTRRTVRDFSPRAVAKDIIERAALAVGTAPSGANMRSCDPGLVDDGRPRSPDRRGHAGTALTAAYRPHAPR